MDAFDRLRAAQAALTDLECPACGEALPSGSCQCIDCHSCGERVLPDFAYESTTENYCGIHSAIWLCAECA